MLELLSVQVRFPEWVSEWRTPETRYAHCLEQLERNTAHRRQRTAVRGGRDAAARLGALTGYVQAGCGVSPLALLRLVLLVLTLPVPLLLVRLSLLFILFLLPLTVSQGENGSWR